MIFNREPDFNNLLSVLRCEVPKRPTLFEFSMAYCDYFAKRTPKDDSQLEKLKHMVEGYKAAGYDYVPDSASNFRIEASSSEKLQTKSLNAGTVIFDRESFEKFDWPNPEDFDYSKLDKISDYLPGGMKVVIRAAGGILEKVTELVGYDNLCYMLFDDPDLVQDLFNAVGSRYLKYYEIALEFESVGAIVSNDDWGFNTQTFLSVPDLRKYVFPWHKKIVESAHRAGKPAMLHSCGYMADIMEDIIAMGYDGKHSFEDNIFSVEQSYEKWGGRIAILGGMDMDFLARSTPDKIKKRCEDMLSRAGNKGGYALGSGNSVTNYIPLENYKAMLSAALTK